MVKRSLTFLGAARAQALFLLLAITGTASLMLNAVDADWVRPAQNGLVLIFAAGTIGIIGSRMAPYERGRWIGILLPVFGALVLAVVFLPGQFGLLMGAALGWVVAAAFLFKPRAPMQYQQAVKHLRKNEISEAIRVMDGLIKAEPEAANHYRFRAQLHRVAGKLDRARRDYEKMLEIARDDGEIAVAQNELAEVLLQANRFEEAREAALKAYALAPRNWVTAYNLGMIEDRLGNSPAVVEYLGHALKAKVPEARHRLLIHFYLVRAYSRLGQSDAAHREAEVLRKLGAGLKEWHTLLESEQAATLRAVLAADIQLAQALVNGEIEPSALAAVGEL